MNGMKREFGYPVLNDNGKIAYNLYVCCIEYKVPIISVKRNKEEGERRWLKMNICFIRRKAQVIC